MLVLIYGANGWIGKQFVELMEKENVNYVCGCARVDNVDNLKTEIKNINPTHIVSFIGRTHGKINEKEYTTIDYLEQKGKLYENIRDNLFSPWLIAEICREKNIHYTYLGTGCIFKYDDLHPFEEEMNGFNENDEPNFFESSYSVVKGFTDRMMHFYERNVLNLRIRMPITETKNNRNFITKITTYKKVCSIKNSMSVLPTLFPYVLDMMKNKTVGTINLTNPGLISHNDILEMYKELVDNNFIWENFNIEEQNAILDAGRSNNYLDTTKLKEMYPDLMNIKDAVRYCLMQYKL
jgi:dTDP-4-dehydrorhamnose reductase